MNQPSTRIARHSLLLLVAAMLLPSCVTYEHDGNEVVRAWKARNTIVPEREWNATRIWRRVSDSPVTYIPEGYATSAPRSASQGRWIADERDGKRFFVPKGGVPGMSEGVLQGDALKNSRPFKATPKVT